MGSEPSYFVSDLAGCRVVTVEGELLGDLKDVLPTGGNDVFVVQNEKSEILIPALKSIVVSVDTAAREIRVSLPKGLRESTTT